MAEIRLIGTAHVSQKSVEDVRSAIEEFQPDIVGVELDRGRLIWPSATDGAVAISTSQMACALEAIDPRNPHAR